MTPTLTHTADITIQVGSPIVVGETPEGIRRVIPILGGTIKGAGLDGTILEAGADYQLIRPDGYTTLDARYAARMADGAMLYVVNTGVRFGPPEIMQRLMQGETVDPSLVYFRTTPRFETTAESCRWLTRPLFLATGARYPDRVEVRVFAVG